MSSIMAATSTTSDIRPRSTTREYDLAVFIGRFQPFHLGHLSVVAQALEKAERVLILVGSANLSRDTRNPFTYDERAELIRAAVHGEGVRRTAAGSGDPDRLAAWDEMVKRRLLIQPLPDSPYDLQEWINTVQHLVRQAQGSVLRPKIALTGHERDQTSFYLKLFPQWDYLPAADTNIEATHIRKAYFEGSCNFDHTGWDDKANQPWSGWCPGSTIRFLDQWRGTPAYPYLMEQKKAEEAYVAQWGKGPHVTADPVVIQSGHVLVIERGGAEGTGMLALPGGFLDVDKKESLIAAAAREGVEETGLFIDDFTLDNNPGKALYNTPEFTAACRQLQQYFVASEVFDDPNRSRRGRIITQASLFKLPDDFRLPRVKGMDDAHDAFWLPISEVRADNMYDDHAFIIEKMMRQHL